MTPGATGAAGELLCQYRLARWNVVSSMPAQHASPYDLLIDHGGRFLSVQVKTSASPTDGLYKFHIGRSQADIWCYVALDKERLLFLFDARSSIPAHRFQKRVEHSSFLIACHGEHDLWM
jgi:hypothetical protein